MLERLALPAKKRPGLLVASMIGLSLTAIWIIFGAIAYETNVSEWKSAAAYTSNVATLFAQDISTTIEVFDVSLKAAAIDAVDPAVIALPAAVQHKIIFDHLANATGLGGMLLIDGTGRVVGDSRNLIKIGLDVSDREYFSAQKDTTLSRQPYISGLTGC